MLLRFYGAQGEGCRRVLVPDMQRRDERRPPLEQKGPTASQRHPGPKLRGAGRSQALVPLGAGDPRILLPCLSLASHLQAKIPPMIPLASSHPASPPLLLSCQPSHTSPSHLPHVSFALPLWDEKRGGMQVRGCKPEARGGSSGGGESRTLPRAACSGRWEDEIATLPPVCLMTFLAPRFGISAGRKSKKARELWNPGAGANSKNTFP